MVCACCALALIVALPPQELSPKEQVHAPLLNWQWLPPAISSTNFSPEGVPRRSKMGWAWRARGVTQSRLPSTNCVGTLTPVAAAAAEGLVSAGASAKRAWMPAFPDAASTAEPPPIEWPPMARPLPSAGPSSESVARARATKARSAAKRAWLGLNPPSVLGKASIVACSAPNRR